MKDPRSRKAGPQSRGPGRPRLDAEMVPRILDAAERLFASRDALHVSIRDIAAEAGLPHSAIYRYFDGKDDVLRQVLERGMRRQSERDAAALAAGEPLKGAIDWFMTENAALARALVRTALKGETASSLGVDAESTARQTTRVLEAGESEFELRTDFDPQVAAAAAMALSLGWAVTERWVVDAVGLGDRDISDIREEIGRVLGSIMALSRDAGATE